MGRPREHDERTRSALQESAGWLLAAHGPDALTLRRVAEHAGTTTQAIYSLFGSKEGLVRAMYREGFEQLDRRLAAVEPTADAVADLLALAFAYRDSALATPHLYDVMFACPIPEFEPSEADQEVAQSALDRLSETVRRHAGAFAGRDPEGMVMQLWALGHGLASLELQGALGDPDAACAHWRQAFEAIVTGYAASRAAAS